MTTELNASMLCAVPECGWHVALPETLCHEHGGAGREAEWRSDESGRVEVWYDAEEETWTA